ncbi:MAG: type III-B CRISPR module RAMP protein Cmr4 [Anaeromicrobium sp.]|jgi:CRISPR-associated protein Cmr4|uniref:type III-B CRISPR module RAMP protein Cmr4 n=1 Tax=Anaeromicrobium sp. TaxID=1929132 RepID=UPI0025FFC163|nr:type III-B CRISPR module RAMP protein Cmr4 [Anaeromicrobium sp.]MCT4594739.1 type III-B CRISPR module RAMP protein Cmr4 [Anaeromicrobium sp.]
MLSKIYKIRALTNMHVGTGDTGYGLVDNTVQRDVVTNYPAIYSSSLKGALRQFARYEKFDEIKEIFGSENTSNESMESGLAKFFQANLLSIPVRGQKKPFYRATCYKIINELIENLEIHKIEDTDGIMRILNTLKDEKESFLLVTEEIEKKEKGSKEIIEGYEVKTKKEDKLTHLENIFGKDIVVFDNETFGHIIEELPVIARNCLDNGESKNLWYEEIVPRETRFYFPVILDEKKDNNGTEEEDSRLSKKLNDLLENKMIQIGANASIGYGYTEISKLGESKYE